MVADEPEALGNARLRVEVRGKLRFQLFGEVRRLGQGFKRP
jgi:hypothetical protein